MNEERRKVTKNFRMEGAKLLSGSFRNFQGKPSEYNAAGDRNFAVILSEEDADMLERDGWNVKRCKPRADDPDQYRTPYLSVKIRFDPYPPIVQLIKFGKRIPLDEETISQLDWTPYENIDLVIRPYNYPARPGRPAGVSAYLKAMYFTAAVDDFEAKYADIPIAGEEEELPFD